MQILGFQECREYGWTSRSSTRGRDCKEGERQADQEDGRSIWGNGEPNAEAKSKYCPGVVSDYCCCYEFLLRHCSDCPSAIKTSRSSWNLKRDSIQKRFDPLSTSLGYSRHYHVPEISSVESWSKDFSVISLLPKKFDGHDLWCGERCTFGISKCSGDRSTPQARVNEIGSLRKLSAKLEGNACERCKGDIAR